MKAVRTDDWAFAGEGPVIAGRIRATPEDFRVYETLNHSPDGEGEHVYVHLRKRGENTQWAADRLAALCGVKPRDIGFAGMKDRHAVTQQWFSVGLNRQPEPDWNQLNDERLTVLEVARHRRKLRRGAIHRNRFELVLTQIDGDEAELNARLERIAASGVPNYFGEQRFGRDGRNVDEALRLFAGGRANRRQRSLYISAARAWLFNELLSRRIRNQTWRWVLAGDVMMLTGSHSVFVASTGELADLQARLDRREIDGTGPLAGTGTPLVQGEPEQMERQVFADHEQLYNGLVNLDVAAARRPLCLIPEDFNWQLADDRLTLTFELPAGAYATAVLREIVEYNHGGHGDHRES